MYLIGIVFVCVLIWQNFLLVHFPVEVLINVHIVDKFPQLKIATPIISNFAIGQKKKPLCSDGFSLTF